MKIKLSYKKVLFTAFLVTVEYLYFINDVHHAGIWSGLEELFYYVFAIILFFITISYCYLIQLLEEKNFIAPQLFFRFAIPYLIICVLYWIFLNNIDGNYFYSHQQYTFNEYIERLRNPLKIIKNIAVMCLTVSCVLSINKINKQL
ncbi:hypothetical protein HNP99_003050 [Flavobacterium sp. 28A]|nr:hypothetical protein [Flavobacterium sp. 28A]